MLTALERSDACRLICETQPAPPDFTPEAEGVERHQFTELCFCLRGRAEMWVGAQLASCEENQVVIIPAGLEHLAAALHSVVSAPEDVFSRLVWLSVFPFGAVVSACESAYGVHRSTPRHL